MTIASTNPSIAARPFNSSEKGVKPCGTFGRLGFSPLEFMYTEAAWRLTLGAETKF